MNGKLFTGEIHVQNRNIVGDSVCKLAFDIPDRNFSTFLVTIVSRSYDKLAIISASEVTTLWRYANLFIIIIIIFF